MVRRGLAEHVVGRRVAAAEVLHLRAVRRHLAGPADVIGRLTGRTLTAARRRGKYLWLELDSAEALLAH
ncbi:MAG: formamidopyrimidine-DNA glycosylase, partial [Pseudonocardiales bacterium]|nr:formamidopyrimidine-DNA glycosylase [Pseudonocardiales bacterium]